MFKIPLGKMMNDSYVGIQGYIVISVANVSSARPANGAEVSRGGNTATFHNVL